MASAQPATEFFTRGKPGEPDNRGESLVAKHAERVQQEREGLALDKLAALMPQMGAMVRKLALQETAWDVEVALGVLRQFQVAHLDKLNALSKKRKKIQEVIEAEAEAVEKAEDGGGSGSSSGDSSSSDSGASGDEKGADGSDKGKHKRKRSSSKDKRSKSSKRHKRSSDKDKKERRSKRSKEKDKKDKKRSRRSASGSPERAPGKPARASEYGKYGVLRESDATAKRPEFMAWALDVQKADVESLSRWEERDLFRQFMDEYNTASLPHRKYYDLEAYERYKRQKEAQKGPGERKERAAFNDEQELQRKRAAERAREQRERLATAYAELQKGDKARDMRAQELLRAEMALAYKTGDYEKANKLKERLAPDDDKKR